VARVDWTRLRSLGVSPRWHPTAPTR
jgi:hypothetical protein